MKIRTALLGTALTVVALVAMACSDSTTSTPSGNVRVYLTDAPIDLTGVTAVNVTITEIVIYPVGAGDGGGIPLDLSGTGPLTVNLLNYRDGQVILVAAQEVPAGEEYERMHLTVTGAEIVRDADARRHGPIIAVTGG